MQRRQQRRGKRHFKTKICVIMTILRSFHVVKRKRCWRSTLQLEYKGTIVQIQKIQDLSLFV